MKPSRIALAALVALASTPSVSLASGPAGSTSLGPAVGPSTDQGASERAPSPAGLPGELHLDAETDPTAFAFRGYSIHAGIGWKRVRLDLGLYGMDLPSFASSKGFDSSFTGYGAKLQVFPFAEQRGAFFGVDAGAMHLRVTEQASGAQARQDLVGAGVHAGWRFSLPYGFYATPWLGVGYTFNAKDMQVNGQTHKASPVTVFPAVHLGYRFH